MRPFAFEEDSEYSLGVQATPSVDGQKTRLVISRDRGAAGHGCHEPWHAVKRGVRRTNRPKVDDSTSEERPRALGRAVQVGMEDKNRSNLQPTARVLPSLRGSASMQASESLQKTASASKSLNGKSETIEEENRSPGSDEVSTFNDRSTPSLQRVQRQMSVLGRLSTMKDRDSDPVYEVYNRERTKSFTSLYSGGAAYWAKDVPSQTNDEPLDGKRRSQDLEHLETLAKDIPASTVQMPSNVLRYYLILTALLWIIVTLPFWVPFAAKSSAPVLGLFVALYAHQVVVWLWMSVRAWIYLRRIIKTMGGTWSMNKNSAGSRSRMENTEVDRKARKVTDGQTLHHIVVIPVYQEPLDVIEMTIQTLAEQTVRDRIIVVLGMEERTPARESMEHSLNQRFGGVFYKLLYSVHPSGLPNEVPGKCSNENWALRVVLEELYDGQVPEFEETHTYSKLPADLLDPRMITVTSCDADTMFPTMYFEYLEHDKSHVKVPHQCIWQAPIFYTWGMPPFYVRVTGLFRPFMQMGWIIPHKIQNNGIYSCMLELCLLKVANGCGFFFDPSYQMEDVHFMVDCQIATGGHTELRPIYLCLVAGPTCGATTWMQIQEWAKQAQRWTIGAAETFHYIIVGGLRTNRIRFFVLLRYIIKFVHLHLIILNASGIVVLLGTSFPPWFLELSGKSGYDPPWFVPTVLGLTGASYLIFLVMFLVDIQIRKLLGSKPVSVWLNLLHLVLTPLVVLGYNLVSFWAIQELSFRGKKVCIHIPAFKGSLAKLANAEAAPAAETRTKK